jgi:hypothetical protein
LQHSHLRVKQKLERIRQAEWEEPPGSSQSISSALSKGTGQALLNHRLRKYS